MRKFLFLFFLSAGVVSASLSSCKKADDENPIAEGVNCTVLVYGASGCGDNLDFTYVEGLIRSLQTVQPGKINIVGEYNFFPEAQTYGNLKGTKRFSLEKAGSGIVWNVEKKDTAGMTASQKEKFFNEYMNRILSEAINAGDIRSEVVNDKPISLYKSENIADFISYAAEKYPASERFVFIITGHGGAWSAEDDREKTKAAAWDNNDPDTLGISAKELVRGIKASKAASKVQAIITDACNMNMMENVTEYATTGAKYSIVSFQMSYGVDYSKLLEKMAYQDNTLEGLGCALDAYCYECVDSDWTFWDLTKVSSINADMKTAVSLFKEDYPKDTVYYDSIIKGLKTDAEVKDGNRRSIHDFWCQMAGKAGTDELKVQSRKIAEGIAGASRTYLSSDKDKNKFNVGDYVSAQALFLGKTMYAGQTEHYKSSFDNNQFYKETGWNTLFEIFSDDINK